MFMKKWIKYIAVIILAFIVGLAIGYMTIIINPEWRVDITTILGQRTLFTIIIIVILIVAFIVSLAYATRTTKKVEDEKPSRKSSRKRELTVN